LFLYKEMANHCKVIYHFKIIWFRQPNRISYQSIRFTWVS